MPHVHFLMPHVHFLMPHVRFLMPNVHLFIGPGPFLEFYIFIHQTMLADTQPDHRFFRFLLLKSDLQFSGGCQVGRRLIHAAVRDGSQAVDNGPVIEAIAFMRPLGAGGAVVANLKVEVGAAFRMREDSEVGFFGVIVLIKFN